MKCGRKDMKTKTIIADSALPDLLDYILSETVRFLQEFFWLFRNCRSETQLSLALRAPKRGPHQRRALGH